MSCLKCCLVALGMLGVPILLGTLAVLQHPDADAGSFFGRFFGYLFQLFGCMLFFVNVFGAHVRKKIYDQYDREGIDFSGMVTKHKITSHRTNFIETRQTHEIEYIYRVVDEESGESDIYRKLMSTTYHCTLCRPEPWRAPAGTREIPLKRLPLLPGSGYPVHLIDEELFGYWFRICVHTLAGIAMAVGILWIFAFGVRDPPASVALGSVWAVVFGVYLGRNNVKQWEQNTLFSGKVETGEENEDDLPVAIAVPVNELDQEEGKDTEMVPRQLV